jgi:hypothetical protein
MTRTCLTCEDIAWLAAAGECIDNIAHRLGITRASLMQHTRRHHLHRARPARRRRAGARTRPVHAPLTTERGST